MTWLFTSSASEGTYTAEGSDGNEYTWNNNVYEAGNGAGPQTIYVNSNNDWQVVSDQTYNTTNYVESYPYIGWGSTEALNSFAEIIGTSTEAGPGYSAGLYWEAAYDCWLDAEGPGQSNGYEVMIWVDTANVSPGGTPTTVTISGVEYSWYVGTGGNGPASWFVRASNAPSDCVTDVKAVLSYAVAHASNWTGGSNPTVSSVLFGWEIWGTNSTNQTFTCTGYTLAFSSSGGGGTPSVTTTSLPEAIEGESYSQALEATGGTTPYTWSVSSGALPSWATLNSGTGVISGTATGGGGSSGTVTAVTATQAGAGAADGMALQVVVLTQALEAGGASAEKYVDATSATLDASLTPDYSGSLPVWAISTYGAATAAAGNAYYSGSPYDNDGDYYGAGKYTGTVTEGTGITVGSSTSLTYSALAAYEIPPDGTITQDASTPALATTTSAETVTSASFTPPAGAVLAAIIATDGDDGGAITIEVTDTSGLGLTWTQRAIASTGTAGAQAAVFTTTIPSGGGDTASFTIEVTDADGDTATQALTLAVIVAASGSPALAPMGVAGVITVKSPAAPVPAARPGPSWKRQFQPWRKAQQALVTPQQLPVITAAGPAALVPTGTAGDVQVLPLPAPAPAITPSPLWRQQFQPWRRAVQALTFPVPITVRGSAALAPMGTSGSIEDSSGGGTLNFQGIPAFTVVRGQYAGTVILDGATAVPVSTAAVDGDSLVILSVQPGSVPAGLPYVASISSGAGFSVKSTSAADTAVECGWWVVETATL